MHHPPLTPFDANQFWDTYLSMMMSPAEAAAAAPVAGPQKHPSEVKLARRKTRYIAENDGRVQIPSEAKLARRNTRLISGNDGNVP